MSVNTVTCENSGTKLCQLLRQENVFDKEISIGFYCILFDCMVWRTYGGKRIVQHSKHTT
jgi:hypothetical protein